MPRWTPSTSNATRSMATGTTPSNPRQHSSRHDAVISRRILRGIGLGDPKAVSEEVPEGNAQLGTGQQQAEEGVAALAALIGAGSAGDLALDHVRPQIALGAVGVQRQLGTIQHSQQLVFVGV